MKNSHSVVIREQLWSPVQNTAVWLGWWAMDAVSTDDCVSALVAAQGRAHRVVFYGDATTGSPAPTPASGIGEVLRFVRRVTSAAPVSLEDRPLVNLCLAGPGDVPGLPAGSQAAELVQSSGAGILLADADPLTTHVLVPRVHPEGFVEWHQATATGAVVPLAVYGPGEADRMLRDAMDQATHAITASGYVPRGRSQVDRASLAVGALSDAFGLPGLPPGVPRRAEGLMVRADTVAAIVEVTRSSQVGAGVDPQVLPLLRAIRHARMTAVDYCMRELLR
ncbi:MAG TPA: hypothetical protein H9867_08860 [Candidatus Corynebacterium gallistercoris]|uniref:Uncharacterized protein n=1 Tax=Candidatus Corynebacterium gallistercoris TaxID=2838530 RepID=A0A9D1URR0_9CORY|nr:hypothetical protein [Candidatus Corynebacterium gallistercoris]